MRKIFLLIALIFLATSSVPVTAQTSAPPAQLDVLCLPGVYLTDPQDCLPLGPSAYLTRMASLGLTFPILPVPARAPDSELSIIPYQYAVLGETATPVYPTLSDAVAGQNAFRVIEAGRLRYVSYIDYADTDNGRFFELRAGGWVRVSSRVSIPHSYPGGVEIVHTPYNSFGWVLPFAPSIETRRTPGYASTDFTGHLINQYELVQVYATTNADGVEWYMVAPDEWLEGRMVGRVIPNVMPPEGVTNGRWIEINLFEQTLAVYDNYQLVYATLIATGMEPYYTRPGLFPIYEKLETTDMLGAFEADRSDFYYLEYVPWTMYYDRLRALHGAYWRTAFGFPQSHGCVNLSPIDAHWLFDWTIEGDWIYVWDPSGRTPTDPSYYGEGGA